MTVSRVLTERRREGTPPHWRLGYTSAMLAGVTVSIGVTIFSFHYALREMSRQFVDVFAAENGRALEQADVFSLSTRLNSIATSVNWTCLAAIKDTDRFLDLKRGVGSCASGLFQQRNTIRAEGYPHIAVEMTLRLPRSLELAYTEVLAVQVLCLFLIILSMRKAASDRLMEERARSFAVQEDLVARAGMISRFAAQVAHDLGSPTAALKGMVEHFNLREEDRVQFRNAVIRIDDMATELRENPTKVSYAAFPGRGKREEANVHMLLSLIAPIMAEKRSEYAAKPGLDLVSPPDTTAYGLFVRVEASNFRRALSNLVNNAAQAVGERGRVEVSVSSAGTDAQVTIRDNGKGIPVDKLPFVGQRGFTFGKAGGHGLGFASAKETIEAWGGKVEIALSEVDKGTTVTARLPLATAPLWFVPELSFPAGSHVLILDDDSGIHTLWQRRLGSLQDGKKVLEIVDCRNPDQLAAWVHANPERASTATFLCDFEIKNDSRTGLDAIETLGIADRAILITSRYSERRIMERCLRLRVRMIPKAFANVVPIVIDPTPLSDAAADNIDAVLIDDDPLTRQDWKRSAARVGKVLLPFRNPAAFLAAIDTIPKDVEIYLDSELGENQPRGEDFAKELFYKYGFKILFLATGNRPQDFPRMAWITRISGKEPPWGDFSSTRPRSR